MTFKIKKIENDNIRNKENKTDDIQNTKDSTEDERTRKVTIEVIVKTYES